MSKLLIHIDATAGWGKTTAIERDIKQYAEISSFWRADRALYLVFTRRNAFGARRRLRGYVKAENIRTLHSFCYSFMKKRPVMDGKLLEEFSERYSYGSLSSGMFFTPKSRNDHLLSFYYWMRNTGADMGTFLEVKREDLEKIGIDPAEVELFRARWESFKREKGAVDYADILEMSEPTFDGIYLALDEAQDCTPLMWRAFERIVANSPNLRRVVIVGDCDQTVYEFQGSDPVYFLTFPETLAGRYGFEYMKWNTRNISRRVPSEPLSFALKFLQKVRFRDHSKEILPAREGGEVLFMTREEFLDLVRKEKRRVVIQERVRHELSWWRERLSLLGISYAESGEDLRRWRAWKGLVEGDERAYLHLWNLFKDFFPSWELFLREKERYLENFYRDPERWVEMLDEKAKAYAEHYPGEPVILTTMHSQKGEEGDVVWVSGRWTKRIKVSDEERKLYFTACTRTKDILVIDREGWHNISRLL